MTRTEKVAECLKLNSVEVKSFSDIDEMVDGEIILIDSLYLQVGEDYFILNEGITDHDGRYLIQEHVTSSNIIPIIEKIHDLTL